MALHNLWTACVSQHQQRQNYFFGLLTSVSATNGKKKKKHIKWKINEKGDLPAFRCYSWMLANTQKLVDFWENMISLNFAWKANFGKTKPLCRRMAWLLFQKWFDQGTASEAPVCWSKYTTHNIKDLLFFVNIVLCNTIVNFTIRGNMHLHLMLQDDLIVSSISQVL